MSSIPHFTEFFNCDRIITEKNIGIRMETS